eukprot:scaffold680865_cov32-Prasinocladus_malaysianus.AAC.1
MKTSSSSSTAVPWWSKNDCIAAGCSTSLARALRQTPRVVRRPSLACTCFITAGMDARLLSSARQTSHEANSATTAMAAGPVSPSELLRAKSTT